MDAIPAHHVILMNTELPKHRLWPITDTSHIKECERYKFQTDNSIAFTYRDSGLNLTRSFFNKCRVLFVLVKVRVPLCTCEADMTS